MYAWKRLSDGEIVQTASAPTADDLFEGAGFGAVDVDKPVKGFLAVPVEEVDGMLRETTAAPRTGGGVMQSVIPSSETLSRIDGGQRFVEWIEPRLYGDAADRETALVMIMAQMSARYAHALHDAAEVLRRISQSKPESRDLAVAANAMAEMERRARLDPITSL